MELTSLEKAKILKDLLVELADGMSKLEDATLISGYKTAMLNTTLIMLQDIISEPEETKEIPLSEFEMKLMNKEQTFDFPADDKNLKSIGKIINRFREMRLPFVSFMGLSYDMLKKENVFGRRSYEIMQNPEYYDLLKYWCNKSDEYIAINEERNNRARTKVFEDRQQLKFI